MNKVKAFILACTPQATRMCAAAAKISSTPGAAIELYDGVDPAKGDALVRKVVGLGHVTITEHAVFNIAFENVSMLFEQFLIEHRLAAYTIKSRRYVDYSDMGALAPVMRLKSTGKPSAVAEARVANFTARLFEDYNTLLGKGIPKEDARFVLPYSLRSHIYCTINARELMHLIYACIHGRGAAYPEIAEIGSQLFDQAVVHLPGVFTEMWKVEAGREFKESTLNRLLAGQFTAQSQGTSPHIDLLEYTGDADLSVVAAAIVAHTSCSFSDAFDAADDETLATQVIHAICTNRRPRELEQINATFRMNSMSLATLTHLARHRMQSLLVPSFTQMTKTDRGVMPESVHVRTTWDAEELYSSCFKESFELYKELEAEGIMKEDLAYLFLSGDTVDVQTTMNGRELFHFLKLRTCNRAQWEIREYADIIKEIMREVAPITFEHAGPGCYTEGKCPEGKMTCGKPITR